MPRTLVIYNEKGEEIFRGPEKLPTEHYFKRLPFGFELKDIIQLAAIAIGVIVFIVQFQEGIKSMQEEIITHSKKIETTEKALAQFIKNSDNYHSAILGTQFEGGKPIAGGDGKISAVQRFIKNAEAAQ